MRFELCFTGFDVDLGYKLDLSYGFFAYAMSLQMQHHIVMSSYLIAHVVEFRADFSWNLFSSIGTFFFPGFCLDVLDLRFMM